MVHCSLAGIAPAYLSDKGPLTSSVGVRSLLSADYRACVPCCAYNGNGNFAAASPSLRNGVSLQLREPDTLFNSSKLLLKSFLF